MIHCRVVVGRALRSLEQTGHSAANRCRFRFFFGFDPIPPGCFSESAQLAFFLTVRSMVIFKSVQVIDLIALKKYRDSIFCREWCNRGVVSDRKGGAGALHST